MPDNRREIKRRAAKQQDENEQLVETFCRALLKTAKEEQKTQLESSEGFPMEAPMNCWSCSIWFYHALSISFLRRF